MISAYKSYSKITSPLKTQHFKLTFNYQLTLLSCKLYCNKKTPAIIRHFEDIDRHADFTVDPAKITLAITPCPK